jgi:hypothetical protein
MSSDTLNFPSLLFLFSSLYLVSHNSLLCHMLLKNSSLFLIPYVLNWNFYSLRLLLTIELHVKIFVQKQHLFRTNKNLINSKFKQ